MKALEEELKPAVKMGYVAFPAHGLRGARVAVDGKEVGRLPLAARAMECGTHEIEVFREGVPPRRMEVTVLPRHTLRAPLVVGEE